MRIFKNGFTLSEMLVVLGIIGAIAMITIPTLMARKPDKPTEIKRQAKYNLTQIISQMHDDQTMYPPNGLNSKQGFRNTDAIYLGGQEYKGGTKFCQLFLSRFEGVKIIQEGCGLKVNSSTGALVPDSTKDGNVLIFEDGSGVQWRVAPDTSSNGFSVDGYTTIYMTIPKLKIKLSDETDPFSAPAKDEDLGCTAADWNEDGTQDVDADGDPIFTCAYHVLANGTITNDITAITVVSNPYKIVIKPKCDFPDTDTGYTNKTCVKKIVLHETGQPDITVNSPNADGEFIFDNRTTGVEYTLEVTPDDHTNPTTEEDFKYTTNWRLADPGGLLSDDDAKNRKIIKLDGFKVIEKRDIKLYKRIPSTLKITVNDCPGAGMDNDITHSVLSCLDTAKLECLTCTPTQTITMGSSSGEVSPYLDNSDPAHPKYLNYFVINDLPKGKYKLTMVGKLDDGTYETTKQYPTYIIRPYNLQEQCCSGGATQRCPLSSIQEMYLDGSDQEIVLTAQKVSRPRFGCTCSKANGCGEDMYRDEDPSAPFPTAKKCCLRKNGNNVADCSKIDWTVADGNSSDADGDYCENWTDAYTP